jgi:hypothetical protein
VEVIAAWRRFRHFALCFLLFDFAAAVAVQAGPASRLRPGLPI